MWVSTISGTTELMIASTCQAKLGNIHRLNCRIIRFWRRCLRSPESEKRWSNRITSKWSTANLIIGRLMNIIWSIGLLGNHTQTRSKNMTNNPVLIGLNSLLIKETPAWLWAWMVVQKKSRRLKFTNRIMEYQVNQGNILLTCLKEIIVFLLLVKVELQTLKTLQHQLHKIQIMKWLKK